MSNTSHEPDEPQEYTSEQPGQEEQDVQDD